MYDDKSMTRKGLSKALRDEDLNSFKTTLETIFSSIPYNNYSNNNIQDYEGFYASIVYVYLQSLGLDIIGEDVASKGRIDLTVNVENKIYIIEFKTDRTDIDALTQIKEKNYSKKYLNGDKIIYLVGIEFDTNEKNISRFEWEKVK
jgi:ATP-dependent exoDNAse (exonuclease V) beta subunit